MTHPTSETQQYTLLFQKLADARSARGELEREEADRVIGESDQIRTVREFAEAAVAQKRIDTYTTA